MTKLYHRASSNKCKWSYVEKLVNNNSSTCMNMILWPTDVSKISLCTVRPYSFKHKNWFTNMQLQADLQMHLQNFQEKMH